MFPKEITQFLKQILEKRSQKGQAGGKNLAGGEALRAPRVTPTSVSPHREQVGPGHIAAGGAGWGRASAPLWGCAASHTFKKRGIMC